MYKWKVCSCEDDVEISFCVCIIGKFACIDLVFVLFFDLCTIAKFVFSCKDVEISVKFGLIWFLVGFLFVYYWKVWFGFGLFYAQLENPLILFDMCLVLFRMWR